MPKRSSVTSRKRRPAADDVLIDSAKKPRSLRVVPDCLRLRSGQDFLKSQVVSKRVPFQRVRKSERAMLSSASRQQIRDVRSSACSHAKRTLQNMRSNFVSVHPSFKPRAENSRRSKLRFRGSIRRSWQLRALRYEFPSIVYSHVTVFSAEDNYMA